MSSPRKYRVLRLIAFSLVALVTLAAFGLSALSFAFRREWAKTKADLLARGEKLSLVEFAPAPVPDDRNFFGDPLWQELIDTIPSKSVFGVEEHRPAIPYEKQQIHPLLSSLIPPGKLEELQRRYPDLKKPNGLPALVFELARRARTSSSAAERTGAQADARDLLTPVMPLLSRVAALAKRPEAVAPVNYPDGPFAAVNHISPLFNAGGYFAAIAELSLAEKKSPEAAAFLLTDFDLIRVLKSDPFLISQLIRRSILRWTCAQIRAGIRDHAWSEPELRAFERQLARIDFLEALQFSLRAERGSLNNLLERLEKQPDERAGAYRTLSGLQSEPPRTLPFDHPLYWNVFRFRDQAQINTLFQRLIDAADTASRQGLRPGDFELSLPKSRLSPLLSFASGETPDSNSYRPAVTLAAGQSLALQTGIACALERYRLKNGTYPSSLDRLVPEFLPAIPADVIADQSFRYRLASADHFDLWSVGWNETDEQGTASSRDNDLTSGDWAWDNL